MYCFCISYRHVCSCSNQQIRTQITKNLKQNFKNYKLQKNSASNIHFHFFINSIEFLTEIVQVRMRHFYTKLIVLKRDTCGASCVSRTEIKVYRLKEVDARWGLLEHHCPECIACDVTMCIHRCCDGALLSVIGLILHLFVMASETQRVYAMFWCKFTPGVEKCYHSFPKDAILTNIWLQKYRSSDGVNPTTGRMCSVYFSYPSKYAVIILVTP